MTSFPESIQFKYIWRKYQQRVLDDLQDHITDDHLHVIAPPGSGKTVLGLEVAIRLNNPTLILAPTISIRNQWIQRFCELFLQTNDTPDWISRDIRNPKFMTVVTYQGLHAACNNRNVVEEEEIEDEESQEGNENANQSDSFLDNILNQLKKQNIKTIVVDEAHHLKNEWWQTLTKVKVGIKPIIVGLTATPPYDVSATEWQRYMELNGPVDSEISVPDLILEGDLCPHQDYVYFTLPTEKENSGIVDFRQKIDKIFQEIRNDETIISAIENHPIWIYPEGQLDWIYNNLSYYSACLIFLNANGKEVPDSHIEIIGDKNFEIPTLDYQWTETLLDFYLFKGRDFFKAYEKHQKELENKLRRSGAIERKQISLSHNKKITGFLTSSISKLNGIKEIVDFEYNQLGSNLRLVILSDFIRKEYLINANVNNEILNKIGVIPIFEKLRRENTVQIKIGVLTGSIIIIPKDAYPAFAAKAAKYGITQINSDPVPFDSTYLLIHQTEQLKHDIVHIVTQIFQQGEIEVLVGTKSLLGEGWDAPAINALILASFVGSFVLSNQMRGRAIRTQKGNSDKTGNIWHLVCIDPTAPAGGDDYELLKRRFKSFVGVSFKEEAGIENGTGRLNLPDNLNQKDIIEQTNQKMFARAQDRLNLSELWKTAVENGTNLVEEIKIPFPEKRDYQRVKAMYYSKTIRNFIITLALSILAYFEAVMQGFGRAARNIRTLQDLYAFLTMVFALGAFLFGRHTFKAFKLYVKYRDISKDIEKISEALLRTLIKTGVMHTDPAQLITETHVDAYGAVYCHLEGGTTFEKSTFINALHEIIAPIDNPRYVIIRKSKFMLLVKQKDYHAVPELLGRKKMIAEYFSNQWETTVGACELIFTRNIEGRKLILRSRIKSLSAQLDNEVEHVSKWR